MGVWGVYDLELRIYIGVYDLELEIYTGLYGLELKTHCLRFTVEDFMV